MDETNDIERFLEAIDNMPEDVMSAKYEGRAPSPRKPEKKKSSDTYDKTLDLHGKTRREAITILGTTLSRCKGKRLRLLVITGRGNNSEGGQGVLREVVLNYLQRAGSLFVREFHFAPRKKGGDGAIEILTR